VAKRSQTIAGNSTACWSTYIGVTSLLRFRRLQAALIQISNANSCSSLLGAKTNTRELISWRAKQVRHINTALRYVQEKGHPHVTGKKISGVRTARVRVCVKTRWVRSDSETYGWLSFEFCETQEEKFAEWESRNHDFPRTCANLSHSNFGLGTSVEITGCEELAV